MKTKDLLEISEYLEKRLYSAKKELKNMSQNYVSNFEELEYDINTIKESIKLLNDKIDDEINEQIDYIEETIDFVESNDEYISLRDKEDE